MDIILCKFMTTKGEVSHIRKTGWIKSGGHILFTHRIEGFTERGSENNVRLEKTPKLPGTCFETEQGGLGGHQQTQWGGRRLNRCKLNSAELIIIN